jgi:serine/threonine protein kinase
MAYKQDKGYFKISHFGGTLPYMAPEIIRLQVFRQLIHRKEFEYFPFKADMWALGVCLYRMLTAQFPFLVPDSRLEPLDQLLRDQERSNWKLPKGIDKEADHLIHRLLEPDFNKRIEMFGVIGHLWLEEQTTLSTQIN